MLLLTTVRTLLTSRARSPLMASVGCPPSIRLDRVIFLPGLSCASLPAAGPTPTRTRLFVRILRPSESLGRLETTRFFQSTTSRARRLPVGSTSLPDVRFQSCVKTPISPLGTSGWLSPLTVQARRWRIVYCTLSGLTCGPAPSNHSDELTPGIQPSRAALRMPRSRLIATPSGAPVSLMSKKSPLTAPRTPFQRPSWLTALRLVTYFGDSCSKEMLGASRLMLSRFIRTWPTGWRPSTWSHSRSTTPGAIS